MNSSKGIPMQDMDFSPLAEETLDTFAEIANTASSKLSGCASSCWMASRLSQLRRLQVGRVFCSLFKPFLVR